MFSPKKISVIAIVSLFVLASVGGAVSFDTSDELRDNDYVRTVYADSSLYDYANHTLNEYEGSLENTDGIVTFSGHKTIYAGSETENSFGSSDSADELYINVSYLVDSGKTETQFWIEDEIGTSEVFVITGMVMRTTDGVFEDILFDICGESVYYSDIAVSSGSENCFFFLGIPVAMWAIGALGLVATATVATAITAPVTVKVLDFGSGLFAIVSGGISYEHKNGTIQTITIGHTKCTAELLTEEKVKKLPKNNYYFVLKIDKKLYFANKPLSEAQAKQVIGEGKQEYNVWTYNSANAQKICGMNPIYHPAHNNPSAGKSGFYNHYHTNPYREGHSFFGLPVWA